MKHDSVDKKEQHKAIDKRLHILCQKIGQSMVRLPGNGGLSMKDIMVAMQQL